jgi:hypothetical protein
MRNVILSFKFIKRDVIGAILRNGGRFNTKIETAQVPKSNVQARHVVETGKTAIGYYVDAHDKVTGVILDNAELQRLNKKMHRHKILVKVFLKPIPLERVKFPLCYYIDREGHIIIGREEYTYDKYRKLGFKPQMLALEQRPDLNIILQEAKSSTRTNL